MSPSQAEYPDQALGWQRGLGDTATQRSKEEPAQSCSCYSVQCWGTEEMKPGGWRQVMGSQGAVQGRLRNPLTQDTVTHVTLQRPELRVELGAKVLLPGQPTSTHPIRASSAGSSSRSLSAQKSRLVCPGDPNLQPPALGLPLFSLRLPPLSPPKLPLASGPKSRPWGQGQEKPSLHWLQHLEG